ncbi:MAG TPA: HD domain-containing protein [Candidatus Dormibacteraeota bacterium]
MYRAKPIGGITLPGTPVCDAAVEVVTTYASPALVNHSLRSYIWGVSYAERQDIAFDAELLFVAAMLHDIGLVPEFDSHTVPFEEAGGHVAWVFGAGAGWPVARRQRVAEIIVRHMWNDVDVASDPEGHVLELATGLDISGRHPEWWPEELRGVVLAALPRLGLREEFLGCFQEQARRKPESTAGQAVASGIAARLAANVLDTADAEST